jgi:peptidoglycan hydrolase CwlO-like protein
VQNEKKIYLIGIVLVIIGVIAWYMFGRADIPNNGNRIDDARTELNNIEKQNSELGKHLDTISTGLDSNSAEAGRVSEGIGSVSSGLGETAKSIDDIKSRINFGQGELSSIKSILDEDERIFKTIRSRGPNQN